MCLQERGTLVPRSLVAPSSDLANHTVLEAIFMHLHFVSCAEPFDISNYAVCNKALWGRIRHAVYGLVEEATSSYCGWEGSSQVLDYKQWHNSVY